MAVQFILGRSGTGKTDYCIGQIIDSLLDENDAAPLILLVPEQATYQAERAILGDPRIKGYSRLKVLSFERLSFLVHGKFNQAKQISNVGKQMAVHSILNELGDELEVFSGSAKQIGTAEKVVEIITELHQLAATEEDVDGLAEKLKSQVGISGKKFADIAKIYRRYLEFISERKFLNPDYQLTAIRGKIGEVDFIKGARLWVDSFASFTVQEMAVLAELIKATSQQQIAMCLDPAALDLQSNQILNSSPVSLFNITETTYQNLVEWITEELKLKVDRPVILEKNWRAAGSSALSHLEKNFDADEVEAIEADGNIEVIGAVDQRAEVEYAAKRITSLVRKKNYRYREIAVVASDIGEYQNFIEAVFSDFDIPFFIDSRKSLQQHQLLEFLISAIDSVEQGFNTADVIAYLKVSTICNDDVDLLENYCLAFGIDSANWLSKKDWGHTKSRRVRFDNKRVNNIRRQAIDSLGILIDAFKDNLTAKEFAKAIIGFVDASDICNQFDGDSRDSGGQILSGLGDLLEQMQDVFGEQIFEAGEIAAIFKDGVSGMSLAFIPPRLDQTLVGSIERSRHPQLKAIILLGATQKQFPVPLRQDNILSTKDREIAMEADFELAGTLEKQLSGRNYLAYIAFTRSSEGLYVTYPMSDDDGKEILPSRFVHELQRLVKVETKYYSPKIGQSGSMTNKMQLADYLCSNLVDEESTPNAYEIFEHVKKDSGLADIVATVGNAIDYSNEAKLSSEVADKAVEENLSCSASRLECFAKCPYQYFAKYTLGLEQRESFKFSPLDIGSYYHEMLDQLTCKLIEQGLNFASASEEQLKACLKETISKSISEDSFIASFVKDSRHNQFIIDCGEDVLADLINGISQVSRSGEFRCAQSEYSFGFDGEAGYEIEIEDGRKVNLRGKIDRIDIAEIDGRKLALIFDYKLTGKDFKWKSLANGMDLQLMVYVLACEGMEGIEPVGAFYTPISPAITGDDKFRYKSKGLFNGKNHKELDGNLEAGWSEYYNFAVTKSKGPYGYYNNNAAMEPGDFEKIKRFAESKITEITKKIFAGDIAIYPARDGSWAACERCDYRALCRFQWNTNSYNDLIDVKKDELLNSVGGEND